MKTQLELSWAGGFLDGEGNIRWNKGKSKKKGNKTREYGCPVMQAAQIDRFVLDRLQSALGEGKVYGPYNSRSENRKPYFVYSVTGIKAIEVFKKIKPYLSPVKRSQIDNTLREYEEQNKRPKLDTRFKKAIKS